MSTRPRVVVSFADAFAAIEATWSLQQEGFDVVALARRGTHPPLRRVRGVRLVEVTAPEIDADSCRREVAAELSAWRPDVVLPLDDASVWLLPVLRASGAAVAGPDAQGAAVALDKTQQLTLALRCGFAVPAWSQSASSAQVPDDACAAGPVVVKPADAVLEVGGRLVRPHGATCADASELAAARALTANRVIVQRFVTGVGEGVFGTASAGVLTSPLSGHRRVRMVNPHGSASSACRSVDVPDDIGLAVERLVSELGWTGLFMVELLRDHDGTPWFMELNGRAWGSLALARRRGFEYPAWAVQDVLGLTRSPAPPVAPAHVTARHLGRELAHLAFVARGPRSTAAEWPRLGPTVKDLLRPDASARLYNWHARQPRVLASDTWTTLADLVRSARKDAT